MTVLLTILQQLDVINTDETKIGKKVLQEYRKARNANYIPLFNRLFRDAITMRQYHDWISNIVMKQKKTGKWVIFPPLLF